MENTKETLENVQELETVQETVQEPKQSKLLINDLYYEADDFGRFTEEEVKNARAKYGKRLRYLAVITPDGKSEFIIKKPSRATSRAVSDAFEKKDNDLASDIMLSNCAVIGDLADIEDDAVVYTKVTTFITSMVKEAELEAKKL